MADVTLKPALAAAVDALQRGDPVSAERLLLAEMTEGDEDADALVLLAAARRSSGRAADAIPLLDRAVALDPAHVEARLAMLDIAFDDNRATDALGHLRLLPDDIRGSFQILAREAELLSRLGEHEQEIALYRRLMELHPGIAGLWVSMANALRMLGRSKEAVAALRQAIAIQPDYGRPWWLLSDLKDFRFDDADIATMTGLAERRTGDADRASLHFALGKAYEDRGDAAQSFDHYAKGNAFRAAAFGRDRIAITGKVERVITTFTADLLAERVGWGHDSDAPIFIVGLQRSGSTLIEQILASHPLIEGTSELPVMSQILRDIAFDDSLPDGHVFDRIAGLDSAQLKHFGQRYLELAAAYRHTDRPRFVDKLPGNWSNIGLIRLILPNARIIDARRNPMATGLSNFKQNFGDGAFFSTSLATIGDYYRQYLRLIAHFERIDPGMIHRVVNEQLIAEFEPTVRSLLDFVGVPFDPACLEFHRTARAVRTPSSGQVRQPINASGVEHWRMFEPWLEPLKQALGPALEGWDLPPGAYRDEEV